MILNKKFKNSFGFSLLELSIVVTIVAVVAATTLNVVANKTAVKKSLKTRDKMEIIAKAIKVYADANNKIPCPAQMGVLLSDAVFGAESCTTVLATSSFGNIISGTVPVLTLGLPTDFMFDEWGRRISYIMDKDMNTVSNWQSTSLQPNIDIKFINSSGTATSILYRSPTLSEVGNTITSCIDGTTITVGSTEYNRQIPICATFVLISHGQNGSYAIDSKGGTSLITSAAIIGNQEKENVDVTSAGSNITFDNIFIDKSVASAISSSSSSSGSSTYNASYFDDILVYRTKRQLRYVATGQ